MVVMFHFLHFCAGDHIREIQGVNSMLLMRQIETMKRKCNLE